MEIKPQELRSGNLLMGQPFNCVRVGYGDGVVAITAYGIGLIESDPNFGKNFKPIELTPEWFKRSGFKEYEYTKEALLLSGSDTYVKTYTLGKLTICDWGDGKFILTNAFNFDLRVEIKTLHHLQNVVYALTGEELAIDKHISNGN